MKDFTEKEVLELLGPILTEMDESVEMGERFELIFSIAFELGKQSVINSKG